MIDILFRFGGDNIIVKVNGKHIALGSTQYGAQLATIEGLMLSKEGTIKEFPDLKDNPNWRLEAIKRFKEKLNSLSGESAVADYVITDLRKFGYVPMFKQVSGKRREAII